MMRNLEDMVLELPKNVVNIPKMQEFRSVRPITVLNLHARSIPVQACQS